MKQEMREKDATQSLSPKFLAKGEVGPVFAITLQQIFSHDSHALAILIRSFACRRSK